MNRTIFFSVVTIAIVALGAFTGWEPAPAPRKSLSNQKLIARGKYLVLLGGCNDCHSPKIMTPQGPLPDTTKLLSGAPAGAKITPVPNGVLTPDGWGALATNDLTTWAGPWGISFARNLTPDRATGLGSWTEEMFIKSIRTGKDMGEGRDILPPMPWQAMSQAPDEDLKAVFAYLQSIPPVANAVPDPVPPAGSAK
jgi:mono/diheme cytochrome c family protein